METGRSNLFALLRVRMTQRSAITASGGLRATTSNRRLQRRAARSASYTSRALPVTRGMVLVFKSASARATIKPID